MVGGAARATQRLHLALLKNGIDSLMLVQRKTSDISKVIGPISTIKKGLSILRPILDRALLNLYKERSSSLFSPSWLPFSGIVNEINKINPDIVHLHWICSGMLRVEDLRKIKAPIVWSLHDDWAFTGGCHIKFDCLKYRSNCGSCPNLGSNRDMDLSRKIWNRKNRVYNDLHNLTIIGLSNWILDCANNSSLLSGKSSLTLPNMIDTERFKPFEPKYARSLWNLSPNKKLILFGALSATSDRNKGYSLLIKALSTIKSKNVECVVFGSAPPQDPEDIDFNIHYLGNLFDDVSLVTIYSAVDVMVVPSLQENLSNTIMESMACSTPVVCFETGGNSDMVSHKINGYLASPFSSKELANGIDWVLMNKSKHQLRKKAREQVIENYSEADVVKKYITLYQKILTSKRS
jgi:glycosyltransferase involved in cell wall biosynthesis